MSRRRMFGIGAAAVAGLSTGCTTENGKSPIAQSNTTTTVGATAAPVSAVRQAPPAVIPAAVAARHSGVAPQTWGMQMPGIISSFTATGKQMALTFDACGGPNNNDIDETLLNLLISQQFPATLFLNKRWIDANPSRAAELAANPLFELANHGMAHRPLSVTGRSAYKIAGTGSPQEAVDEVWANHERLTALLGKPPRFFRAGTAHYDDVAVSIVNDLGETPVGFSINADYGATAKAGTVANSMNAAQPGAISLAHMHRPKSATAAGMTAALPTLCSAGFTFVHL
ncbi:polysaccharide deacetylase family protein [Nocardia australiensis]|uniref:polysaccharide deacetylase family protein n=1 Tax=Nocardia australiensis TaxID=2887191 RepID=UPI001D13D419|nr:polysaccharide deacetylase family protein [Nocardia australiensis]